MASGVYNQAKLEIGAGTIQLGTTALKLMLVSPSYTFNPDHTVIDNGGNNSTDPSFNEIVATNYTGGFAGGGRKSVTITSQVNNTLDRAEFAIDDLTWSSLGGATNDTIGAAILVREVTNDTLSRLVVYFDLADTATNGSDITLDFASLVSGGNIRLA